MGRIDRAVAEHQVLVNALDHVLDVDVPDAGPRHGAVRRCLLPPNSGHVPRRWSGRTAGVQPARRAGRSDRACSTNIPGSGSNARGIFLVRHAGGPVSASAKCAEPSSLPTGECAFPDQNDTASARRVDARSIDRPRKSTRRSRREGSGSHQGRIVLEPRVEEVPRPRLDNADQPAAIERRADLVDLPCQESRLFIGVERAGVQGDRDAGIALIGEQLDGIEHSVMDARAGMGHSLPRLYRHLRSDFKLPLPRRSRGNALEPLECDSLKSLPGSKPFSSFYLSSFGWRERTCSNPKGGCGLSGCIFCQRSHFLSSHESDGDEPMDTGSAGGLGSYDYGIMRFRIRWSCRTTCWAIGGRSDVLLRGTVADCAGATACRSRITCEIGAGTVGKFAPSVAAHFCLTC